MRVHKYINDPKELLEQGKQIVSENADNIMLERFKGEAAFDGYESIKIN